ncbi:glutamine-hydrolyzing carbamoyl-phosphate synthase small subunit [Candidatus Woesearchaeota archaeon]|nr:glutamine-hydrolyzing carbamoyl-phosphate synthase small subunit [Candidatus Woesearchaeota archaeon]
MNSRQPIKLVLSDGTVFEGHSFGAYRSVAGEVVFNTGMVGYPQAFTDPSYRGQILVLTYPLIGNYGVPSDEEELGFKKHFESNAIHISGLIVSEYSDLNDHWASKRTLPQWLQEQSIPAIYDIDTRALTKKLREHGVMLGKIIADVDVPLEDPNQRNLVAEVSIKNPCVYNPDAAGPTVVVIDTGCKYNILRNFIKRDVKVMRVPWDYDFTTLEFDGLFIANGPGDPKMCTKTIEHVRTVLEKNIPIFGICLGNQILALACGADTYKLKYGHRSQNQPCINLETGRCYITPQNHGFAVNAKKLPEGWKEWFVNANDSTNEGIMHETKPFMSVQFHPEAKCGPVDCEFLFDVFLEQVKKR